jgi:hypothetical protein
VFGDNKAIAAYLLAALQQSAATGAAAAGCCEAGDARDVDRTIFVLCCQSRVTCKPPGEHPRLCHSGCPLKPGIGMSKWSGVHQAIAFLAKFDSISSAM